MMLRRWISTKQHLVRSFEFQFDLKIFFWDFNVTLGWVITLLFNENNIIQPEIALHEHFNERQYIDKKKKHKFQTFLLKSALWILSAKIWNKLYKFNYPLRIFKFKWNLELSGRELNKRRNLEKARSVFWPRCKLLISRNTAVKGDSPVPQFQTSKNCLLTPYS